MKKILFITLTAVLLFFVTKNDVSAQSSALPTQYYKVVDGTAYPISESEAEEYFAISRSTTESKTNTIYSNKYAYTSVAKMTLTYTSIISNGRPQFTVYRVSAFALKNDYTATYSLKKATGDYITYTINYSKASESGTTTTTFLP